MTTTNLWSRLLDLIAPRLCPICGERLSASEQAPCTACYLHLPRTGFQLSADDNEMAQLFWGQLPLQRAVAPFYYVPRSEAARIIYRLKYGDHPELGENIGRLMARELDGSDFFDGIDALVPVPLARRRQRQRGYNQSQMLAHGISEVTRLPIISNAVSRIGFTQSQTQLSRWQRRENVEHLFRLERPESLRGKHLLIIDDICTTGATLIACGQALRQADQVTLSVLTFGFTKS